MLKVLDLSHWKEGMLSPEIWKAVYSNRFGGEDFGQDEFAMPIGHLSGDIK